MTSPYLRAAARLRAQAALKLEQRLGEEVAAIEVVDVAVVERARDDQGRFIEDDPSTPDVDEAWVRGQGQ
jgi:hypothetical protein